MSPFRPEHVNASDFPELEAPSTGEDLGAGVLIPRWHEVVWTSRRTNALSSTREERRRRWPAEDGRRTCSSTFENVD